jgi:PAS domain S-box-containing protein
MLRHTLPDIRPSRTVRGSSARPRSSTRHYKSSVADTLPPAGTFEQLFALSRDALVLSDVNSFQIVRWNPAAERLFGYSAKEAIGRPLDLVMPPAVARLHREQIAHYARTGELDVLLAAVPQVRPALTASHQEIRVESSMAPLELPGSPPRYVLHTFRDARCLEQEEQHALAMARAEAAIAETQGRLRRCEQLIADSTSHLQPCIASAKRTSSRLARAATKGEAKDRLALLARVVDERAEQIQGVLDQIAETAAIEAGSFTLNVERVNLVPLVGRIVASARARSAAHRVSFGAPQGLTALVDGRRIEHVLRDVIDRAVRRNPRGCWIDVDVRRPLTACARIEVRDYGRSLSIREREQLTKPPDEDRGWFLDRFIVEQHGGSLSLEWPSDGGVRVIIALPTNRVRLLNTAQAEASPTESVQSSA